MNTAKALFSNMRARSIEHEQNQTTFAKSKELKPIIERMTHGKRGDLHARRQAAASEQDSMSPNCFRHPGTTLQRPSKGGYVARS